MKIGILTYHRSQNYGALLQSRALQEFLKSKGHEVCFVDYWPDYSAAVYKPFDKQRFMRSGLLSKIKYLIRSILIYSKQKERARKTLQFIEKYLNISDSKAFDAVVYGSDQIWRKQHSSETGTFNPIYFANDYVTAPIKISYAASMGKIEIDTKEDVEFISDHLKNFNAISVREINLQNAINEKIGISTKLVSDPVLLLSRSQWQSFCDNRYLPNYKYILYYRLAPMKETDMMLQSLVRQTGLKVIELRSYMPNFKFGERYRMTADAQEFISLINGAEYIVTSSFHGTALSIILGKEFYCTCAKSVSGRITSLLSVLGLSERFVTNNYDRLSLENRIDYETIDQKREQFAQESRDWLLASLKK